MRRTPLPAAPFAASPNRRGKRFVAIARRFAMPWLALACLALVGCEEVLETRYGRRGGNPGAKSINGTAVFASMFEQAGWSVQDRRTLTPSMQKTADVIVWFPDNHRPPSAAVVEWFNDWLAGSRDRTLVYIGRDYDAEPDYWESVLPGAPEDQRDQIEQHLAAARRSRDLDRGGASRAKCKWFALRPGKEFRKVSNLSGPWSAGVDAERAAIQVRDLLDPTDEDKSDTYLAAGDRRLVFRLVPRANSGRVMVVANGSFLLNYPLLNHEHRKLATRLIDALGPPRHAIFFESYDNPAVLPEEPEAEIPNGLELFGIWPLNLLLVHLGVLGIVFCLVRWPIFGRPRHAATGPLSDFGRHVDALGELLEITRDSQYAKERLVQYEQLQRGEATAQRPPLTEANPTASSTEDGKPVTPALPPATPRRSSSPGNS